MIIYARKHAFAPSWHLQPPDGGVTASARGAACGSRTFRTTTRSRLIRGPLGARAKEDHWNRVLVRKLCH